MRGDRDTRVALAHAVAILFVALLASCSSTGSATSTAQLEPTATRETAVPAEPEPTATPEPTAEVEPTATALPEPTAEPKPTATAEPAPTPTPTPQADCVVLADFSSVGTSDDWVVVNDNVMGGRSLGERSFANGTMTFAGAINTDGGGFASIRLALLPGAISSADRLVLRARSDLRSYLVTLDDSLDGRDRRISFRAPFTTAAEWETVTVPLADFSAAYFGEPVEAQPLRSDLATRIGIMQSDGIDGEFMIEIDSIEACG